ncbi:MAG: hypothetical protein IKS60_00245 [Lachnospiraceae bacterium]|nr:hypothetical protein [Lachnospiraceae bacterium]MBR4412020.1 hypothetical protein [Lachnospiraceae bacterium]MBR5066565.1 hypothetical protein [Lachnospiraceae bacterium]MBR5918025.1 hypothetical protein [Lachnospiraceae bacterium]
MNLLKALLDGRLNHIVPITFMVLAMIFGTTVFYIRYMVYKNRKKKFEEKMSNLENKQEE